MYQNPEVPASEQPHQTSGAGFWAQHAAARQVPAALTYQLQADQFGSYWAFWVGCKVMGMHAWSSGWVLLQRQ